MRGFNMNNKNQTIQKISRLFLNFQTSKSFLFFSYLSTVAKLKFFSFKSTPLKKASHNRISLILDVYICVSYRWIYMYVSLSAKM